MGLQSLLLYLTVTSGYLIVTYVAGSKLTRSQTLFISALFLVFAVYALWGVTQYWYSGERVLSALEASGALEQIRLNYVGVEPQLIAFPMGVLGIIGSLKFMWDVRRASIP